MRPDSSRQHNSQLSRQREHQANERTFLAWLRTSISLIGFGFAIARFGLFLEQLQAAVTEGETSRSLLISSEALGLCLVIFGIIVIVLAALRYSDVYRQIERASYHHNRSMIFLITGIMILLGILSIPLLL